MTADVSAGVAWVLRHAAKWGGDCERCAQGWRWQAARPIAHPSRSVTLVGQSAGAHLAALAVLQQAERCVTHLTRP